MRRKPRKRILQSNNSAQSVVIKKVSRESAATKIQRIKEKHELKKKNNSRKSLLIVSLPRSLSSATFLFCHKMIANKLKIDETNDIVQKNGEILNHLPKFQEFNTYIACQLDDDISYKKYKSTLDKYTNGYLIKDVVQPLIVSRYLRENPNSYNVLYIKRDPVEVIHRMWERKWMWPTILLDKKYTSAKIYAKGGKKWKEGLLALTKSILLLEDRCFQNTTETITYEELISDSKILRRKLIRMNYNPIVCDYRDSEFIEVANKAKKIKNSKLYKTIKELIREQGLK